MGVAGRQRELAPVALQIAGHVLLGLFVPGHDGVLVVAGGGQDADPREHEDGGQPKQGEVDPKTAGALQDGGDAEQQRHQPQHRDGQRHPAVAGLAAEVGPLAAGGLAQLLGQLGLLVQIAGGVLQGAEGALGLVGQLGLFAGGPLLLPPGQAGLGGGADQLDLRVGPADAVQHLVHLLFVFEVALFLPAAVVLHHQVGDGGKDPFLRKAALAHGHPLEHPGDGRIGDVIAPVDVKAVEIQRLFSDAAGAELFAVFLVGGQGVGVQGRAAQAGRFE